MKNILKFSALMLIMTLLLVPFLGLSVSAEDTTDLIESTDTPSGMDTGKDEDGGIIGDITGALTPDSDRDTDKDTEKDKEKDTEKDTEKDGIVSDAESMLEDVTGGGNISTGDDGTIDETPENDGAGLNVWVIIVAILIVVGVLILVFAMMPKKKD